MHSAGVANICTASLFMARPMGFRVLAALSSGRMPDECRFLASVCVAASASVMNTTSWPIGSWTFGWSELCLLIPTALFHPVSVEAELRRPKTALEPWIILSSWIWHTSHLPIDELNIMAEAMRRFLDSDGNRHAIGDLDELREAVDRVKAYQDFQPDNVDRRELNRRLRTLTQDRQLRR